MTLGQAYEELRCLRSPGNVPNSGCISGPELAAKAEISVDELSAITLFPVSYMSPDILSDPVAFSQFFINHHARPFYQSSGPFSRQSIQELHATYCQPRPAKCRENAGAANAGPAVTTGEASTHYALSNPHLEPAQDVCTTMLVDVHTNSVQNSTGEGTLEKWREKGYGENEVEKDKDGSMMVLGMDVGGFAQDLVGTSGKEPVEQMARTMTFDQEWPMAFSGNTGPVTKVWGDSKGATEKLESSCQSHNRSDITFDAIRNPSALPIPTSSEWDPGPDKSAYTVPAVEEYKADYLLTSGHFQAEDGIRDVLR